MKKILSILGTIGISVSISPNIMAVKYIDNSKKNSNISKRINSSITKKNNTVDNTRRNKINFKKTNSTKKNYNNLMKKNINSLKQKIVNYSLKFGEPVYKLLKNEKEETYDIIEHNYIKTEDGNEIQKKLQILRNRNDLYIKGFFADNNFWHISKNLYNDDKYLKNIQSSIKWNSEDITKIKNNIYNIPREYKNLNSQEKEIIKSWNNNDIEKIKDFLNVNNTVKNKYGISNEKIKYFGFSENYSDLNAETTIITKENIQKSFNIFSSNENIVSNLTGTATKIKETKQSIVRVAYFFAEATRFDSIKKKIENLLQGRINEIKWSDDKEKINDWKKSCEDLEKLIKWNGIKTPEELGFDISSNRYQNAIDISVLIHSKTELI